MVNGTAPHGVRDEADLPCVKTMEVLATQLTTTRHAITGEASGMDVFEVEEGEDPWYVPQGAPRHERLDERVCDEHQKVKSDEVPTSDL